MENMYSFPADLGRGIREARKDKGLTQLNLAQAANVSRLTVIRAEKGENVGIADIYRIVRSLNLSLELTERPWPTWENAQHYFREDDDE